MPFCSWSKLKRSVAGFHRQKITCRRFFSTPGKLFEKKILIFESRLKKIFFMIYHSTQSDDCFWYLILGGKQKKRKKNRRNLNTPNTKLFPIFNARAKKISIAVQVSNLNGSLISKWIQTEVGVIKHTRVNRFLESFLIVSKKNALKLESLQRQVQVLR